MSIHTDTGIEKDREFRILLSIYFMFLVCAGIALIFVSSFMQTLKRGHLFSSGGLFSAALTAVILYTSWYWLQHILTVIVARKDYLEIRGSLRTFKAPYSSLRIRHQQGWLVEKTGKDKFCVQVSNYQNFQDLLLIIREKKREAQLKNPDGSEHEIYAPEIAADEGTAKHFISILYIIPIVVLIYYLREKELDPVSAFSLMGMAFLFAAAGLHLRGKAKSAKRTIKEISEGGVPVSPDDNIKKMRNLMRLEDVTDADLVKMYDHFYYNPALPGRKNLTDELVRRGLADEKDMAEDKPLFILTDGSSKWGDHRYSSIMLAKKFMAMRPAPVFSYASSGPGHVLVMLDKIKSITVGSGFDLATFRREKFLAVRYPGRIRPALLCISSQDPEKWIKTFESLGLHVKR